MRFYFNRVSHILTQVYARRILWIGKRTAKNMYHWDNSIHYNKIASLIKFLCYPKLSSLFSSQSLRCRKIGCKMELHDIKFSSIIKYIRSYSFDKNWILSLYLVKNMRENFTRTDLSYDSYVKFTPSSLTTLFDLSASLICWASEISFSVYSANVKASLKAWAGIDTTRGDFSRDDVTRIR